MPPIREQAQIASVDRSGNATPVSAILGQHSDVRLSPDGHRLATHMMDEENDVWIDDLNRGTRTRVTHDRMEDETPVWSPDGRYVAYAASRAGPARGVFRREANSSGPEELVASSTTAARGIMATTMASQVLASFSLPRLLFADRFERPQPDGHTTYDVAADGRFQ